MSWHWKIIVYPYRVYIGLLVWYLGDRICCETLVCRMGQSACVLVEKELPLPWGVTTHNYRTCTQHTQLWNMHTTHRHATTRATHSCTQERLVRVIGQTVVFFNVYKCDTTLPMFRKSITAHTHLSHCQRQSVTVQIFTRGQPKSPPLHISQISYV